jgi:GGDEF domain-containing protein
VASTRLDPYASQAAFVNDLIEGTAGAPPPTVDFLAVLLTAVAAALVLVGTLNMARVAWVPAFAAALVVLPWRSWRGVTLFGSVGSALVGLGAILSFGPLAPLGQVSALLVATMVVAAAEAVRVHRWRSMLLDPVTGLPGPPLTRAMLRHEVAAARRGRPLSVVLLGFSGRADEERLREVGRALRSRGRAMDVVGRLGPDTFLGILPTESPEGAAVFADRMRAAAASVPSPTGPAPDLGAGIAFFERDSSDEGSLLERATQALEQARTGALGPILMYTRSGVQPPQLQVVRST